MNIKEIRSLTAEELDVKVKELHQKLFELRRQRAVGQLEHPDEIRYVRKDIAKLETVKRERELNLPEGK